MFTVYEKKGQEYDRKWKQDVKTDKKRERKERFLNSSGLEVQPLYTPFDLKEESFSRDIGYPGEFPFTRGIHHNMHRGRLWTMRQFSGFGTPEQTNQRYHYLLKNGQTGLSVAFDLPTLMGYDSDDPFSLGEVGKCGVAVDTLEDMEKIFEGIPLDKISTSMTINGPAAILLAMYVVTAQKQGVSPDKLRGTLQNDILKEYIAQKEWICPPEPSMKLIVDVIEYCCDNVPYWNTISISGYHIREAGATAVQELAFTLADGFAYVEAAQERGLHVDQFAPRLSFFFNCHNNFFEEIAKFRAARRIWARHMKEKYKAENPRSMKLRFHTQSAGCTLTAQQPENNVIRVAYQALAAVLGGTQSLHTNSWDEALALPAEESVKISLRTQQILAEETGVPDTVDPLGGSYYVEYLTDWIENECEKYFERIEREGGVISAIKKGYFQREIARAAYEYQKKIESKENVVVGVNKYVEEEENPEISILRIDERVEKDKIEKLKALKSRRDGSLVINKLSRIKESAQNEENLMYPIIEAVKVYATIGEIVHVLKDVYGEYSEPAVF